MAIALEPTLTRQRLSGCDFSGQNLRQKDLSHSEFVNCNFDGTDLTEADCTGSDFTGSTFREAILYRTNFRDACLAATVFEPRDCFGMTLTLECRTFQNMRMGALWQYCWLILLTLTVPGSKTEDSEMRDRLLGLIGTERYVRLKNLFQRREL